MIRWISHPSVIYTAYLLGSRGSWRPGFINIVKLVQMALNSRCKYILSIETVLTKGHGLFSEGYIPKRPCVCVRVCVLATGGLTEVTFVMWLLSAGGQVGERWSERTEPIVCKVTLWPKPTVCHWGFTAGSKSLGTLARSVCLTSLIKN